jgi:uncharacterized protein
MTPWVVALLVVFLAGNAWRLVLLLRGSRKDFGENAARIYNFNTAWFPLLLAIVGLFAYATAYVQRQQVFGAAAMLTAVAMFAVRVYATHIEPKRIRMRRIRVPTTRVSRPVRLVHISDMETDAVRRHERRVARLLKALEADLIIHTGDLLNPIPPATYRSEVPKMRDVWSQFEPPMGKLTTIGEVDEPIEEELRRGIGGLRSISDSTVTVGEDSARISIHALSLARSRGEDGVRAAVEEWLTGSDGTFRLLVGHSPDYILEVQDLPIDLCLAGHTHGGQIRIPFFGPIVTLSKVPRKLAFGFHEVGNTRINVTGGVGFEHSGNAPAIRINCPPEICLIELVPTAPESPHEEAGMVA